jgi:hypothetical protein
MYQMGVEYKRDHYHWGLYDQLYSRVLSLGMRPLFVLTNAPCWAAVSEKACKRGKKSDLAEPPAPGEYDEWREFAGLVARYAEALAIEIWNEPIGFHPFAAFWHRDVQAAVRDARRSRVDRAPIPGPGGRKEELADRRRGS